MGIIGKNTSFTTFLMTILAILIPWSWNSKQSEWLLFLLYVYYLLKIILDRVKLLVQLIKFLMHLFAISRSREEVQMINAYVFTVTLVSIIWVTDHVCQKYCNIRFWVLLSKCFTNVYITIFVFLTNSLNPIGLI